MDGWALYAERAVICTCFRDVVPKLFVGDLSVMDTRILCLLWFIFLILLKILQVYLYLNPARIYIFECFSGVNDSALIADLIN